MGCSGRDFSTSGGGKGSLKGFSRIERGTRAFIFEEAGRGNRVW